MNMRWNARLVYSMGLCLILCLPGQAVVVTNRGNTRVRTTLKGGQSAVPMVRLTPVSGNLTLTPSLPGLKTSIGADLSLPKPVAVEHAADPAGSMPVPVGENPGETVLESLEKTTLAIEKPGAEVSVELDKLYNETGRLSVESIAGEAYDMETAGRGNGLRRHVPSGGSSDRKGPPSPKMTGKDSAIEKAVGARDSGLTNELLARTAVLREQGGTLFHEAADGLALAVQNGRFKNARKSLDALAEAELMAPDKKAFRKAWGYLDKKLPGRDLSVSGILSQATRELLGTMVGDPFQLQTKLFHIFFYIWHF